jgi:guanine deaminase
VIIYRARVFTPTADPFAEVDGSVRHTYHEDGFVAVDETRIAAVGSWSDLPPEWRAREVVTLGSDTLIAPGFIDTHLHAPQLEMIGSYGGHLLEWLNRYTFPTEMKFADPEHARRVATALYRELLKNGTTSALIFSTIHTEATNVFFREADRSGIRAIIGKTLMDRNAPDGLLQPVKEAWDESRELIREWHGRHARLAYAVTPRFAPTCTDEMLAMAGDLKREFPDVWIHSHISENLPEVKWVRELFPDSRNYADVYDHFGLLTSRSVLAHGVHLSDEELALFAERDSRVSHCPNSNLFLGSGLFPLQRVIEHHIHVGLGSDIGAGTTPSLLSAMSDAYKVQQVRGTSLSPFHLWYLATLGGARTLSLDATTGSLEAGKEADFLLLDLHATSLLSMRTQRAHSLEDLLAGLVFIGDDRVVKKTFVAGREVYSRD